jgi:hypothetical protein
MPLQICNTSTYDANNGSVELVSAMAKSNRKRSTKKVSFAIDVMVIQIENTCYAADADDDDDDHHHHHFNEESPLEKTPDNLCNNSPKVFRDGRIATEQDLHYDGTDPETIARHVKSSSRKHKNPEKNAMLNDLNHEKVGIYHDLNHEKVGLYHDLNHEKNGGSHDLQSQADAFIARFKQNLSVQNRNQSRKQRNQQYHRGFRLVPN